MSVLRTLEEIRKSPFALIVVTAFCLVIWPVIIFLGLTAHEAQQAEMLSEKTAQTIANFSKTPFEAVTLDSIAVDGQKPLAPTARAVFVTVCSQMHLRRSVVVSRDVTAMVGRTINSAIFKQPLPAGLEHFTVRNNPNVMTPSIIVASNWQRYVYLSYNTFLQAVPLASGPYEMQDIQLFIIDAGQQIPKPGDPPPNPPANPGPQPSCPASSAVSPPASVP
jgi:hypothetical protein